MCMIYNQVNDTQGSLASSSRSSTNGLPSIHLIQELSLSSWVGNSAPESGCSIFVMIIKISRSLGYYHDIDCQWGGYSSHKDTI